MKNKFNLKEYINNSLIDLRFKSFTEIQEKVIPLSLKGKDLIGKSQTGSGKTHSFLIPVFQKLEEEKKNFVQTVIISPTRELALQIEAVSKHIASFYDGEIDIRTYVGGSNRERELDRLKSSQPQIVIATPGKLHDLAIKEPLLEVYTATNFIVDEADMALESGFIQDIDKVAGLFPDNLNMMIFSATIPKELVTFAKKYMDNPINIEIKAEEVTSINIDHILIPTKSKDKFEYLNTLLGVLNPYIALIFANKKETVTELHNFLSKTNKSVGIIHGDLEPRERKRMIKRIMNNEFQLIVASDIAARGIDITGVSHVVNYELPKDYEFYIHRTGRTGRANMDGIAVTMYDYLDDRYLDKLDEKGIQFTYKTIKNNELVETKERNERQKRVSKMTTIEKIAVSKVRKSKKVKPGHKKKRQEDIKREKRKLQHEEFRKNRKEIMKKNRNQNK